MSHAQEITYKVCVYEDAYSRNVIVIGNYRKREKAEQVLAEYLRNHDSVSRAYIETSSSFRNDKRNQWRF